MIDPSILRSDPDRLRESQRRRGESVGLIDDLVAADVTKRAAQTRFDELRNEQKTLGKQIGPLQGALKKAADDGARRTVQAELDTLMAQAQELAEEVKAADETANAASAALDALWLQVSNLVSLESPVGGEEDFAVLAEVGAPRDFAAEGFEPRDHVELGRLLEESDAVTLHARNAERTRFFGKTVAAQPLTRDRIGALDVERVDAIYGALDAITMRDADTARIVLQAARPGLRFEAIPGAGHWVQYERAAGFEAALWRLLGP